MALRHRVAGHVLRAWWRLRRPRTFGVRAVVTDPAGRIALVRHSYLPGRYLPGGAVDKREAAEAAIRRELAEEVALTDIEITGLVGVYHNLAQGKDDHVVVYAACVSDPDALRRADPARTHCLGCLRTLAEIARWGSASDAERAGIVAALAERRQDGRP